MTGKLFGAMLVICGCGGMGFAVAAASRREEVALHRLLSALNYMQCELQYRMTSLPELCRQAGIQTSGTVSQILLILAEELELQVAPDAASCISAAMTQIADVPRQIRRAFEILGNTLGRFDVEGQIRGLEAVRNYCREELGKLSQNRDTRLRSYQTLGICAGAALAILFI